jgi:acyl-[acyl carrier protein]--UDP-N-acetylglucosamine O-acyltransferase
MISNNYYSFNNIDEDVIIYPNVKIGKNNIIKSGTIIYNNVCIGDNNIILQDNRIGVLPVDASISYKDLMMKDPDNNSSFLTTIGNNNFFHINNKISQAITIGDYNKFLSDVYISHDNKIHNNVTFYPRVFSSGYVEFFDHSNLGAGCFIQQNCKIGAYSMIGMNGVATKSVLPFMICVNNKYLRLNIKKMINFDDRTLKILKEILNNIIKNTQLDPVRESLILIQKLPISLIKHFDELK